MGLLEWSSGAVTVEVAVLSAMESNAVPEKVNFVANSVAMAAAVVETVSVCENDAR